MPVRHVALAVSEVVVMSHSAVSLKFGTRDVHAYELPEEKHHRDYDKLQASSDIATELATLSLNFELFIKMQGCITHNASFCTSTSGVLPASREAAREGR